MDLSGQFIENYIIFGITAGNGELYITFHDETKN
jgi:hypothetical protein